MDVKATPGLVAFAERGEFDSPAVMACLKEELSGINIEDYGILVFGCTHFNHFKAALRRIMAPGTEMIDGSAGTARNLVMVLNSRGCVSEGKSQIHYYTSGREVVDNNTISFYESVMAHLEEGRDL